MKKSTKRALKRCWGYLLLAFIAYAWFGLSLDPVVLTALSSAVVIYTLFQAPMWCCAETRDNLPCRNNAFGILMGCHLREHQWQKLKMVIRVSSWGRLGRRVLSSFGGQAAAISAMAASVSAVVALVTLIASPTV